MLDLSHNHRIGMPEGFLRQRARVDAADDHRYAPAAELIGDGICAWNFRGKRGDADQIESLVEWNRIGARVEYPHIPIGRREGGDDGKPQADKSCFAVGDLAPETAFVPREYEEEFTLNGDNLREGWEKR